MWRWATCSRHSRPGPAGSAGAHRPSGRAHAAALAVLASVALGPPASARVLLRAEEALRLAFPGCEVERASVFLTEAQLARARELAGEPVRSALVPLYRARCGGKPGGTAYVDVHTVRTLRETLLVILDTGGRVARVEVLAFDEPADYLPRAPWYARFEGRSLDAELRLARGIPPVTGASLTARATTAAVRRVLAIHQAIAETTAPAPQASPAPRGQAGPPPPPPPRSGNGGRTR